MADYFREITLTGFSTNKAGTTFFADSFNIKKVRVQNGLFGSNTDTIVCYLDFDQFAALAKDAESGRLFKKLDENGPMQLYIGGSKNSKRRDNGLESVTMNIAKSGDKIFVNMSAGPGKTVANGAIQPDGQADLKISTATDVETFRTKIMYIYDCIKAYLPRIIANMVNIAETNRQQNN